MENNTQQLEEQKNCSKKKVNKIKFHMDEFNKSASPYGNSFDNNMTRKDYWVTKKNEVRNKNTINTNIGGIQSEGHEFDERFKFYNPIYGNFKSSPLSKENNVSYSQQNFTPRYAYFILENKCYNCFSHKSSLWKFYGGKAIAMCVI